MHFDASNARNGGKYIIHVKKQALMKPSPIWVFGIPCQTVASIWQYCYTNEGEKRITRNKTETLAMLACVTTQNDFLKESTPPVPISWLATTLQIL